MYCTATGSVQSAVGSFLFYIHVGRTSGKAEGRLLMGTVLSSGTGGAGRFGASAGGMGAEGSRDGGPGAEGQSHVPGAEGIAPVPPQRRRSRAVSRLSRRPLPIGPRPPARTPIGCSGSAPLWLASHWFPGRTGSAQGVSIATAAGAGQAARSAEPRRAAWRAGGAERPRGRLRQGMGPHPCTPWRRWRNATPAVRPGW